MSTPIDFDGDTYDEPIPDVDFRVGAPRTRWGWTRALKKLIKEETNTEKDETDRREAEKTAVAFGLKCRELDNHRNWEEYRKTRVEWMDFLKGFEGDLLVRLTHLYWQEHDRGQTEN